LVIDIACIGAGPSISFAVLEILKHESQKYNIQIFEEHPQVGIPIQCAGLISTTGFQRLKIRLPKECIQNEIKGSRFFSPSGHELFIKRPDIQAYVIDRAIFDQFLMDKVVDLGGKLFINTRVQDLQRNSSNGMTLSIQDGREKRTLETRLVIDGEGVRAKFIRKMNLIPPSRHWNVPALQHEFTHVRDIDPDHVELYFGRRVSPGFFAYIIPKSETTARVCVASNQGNIRAYMKNFINKHAIASEKLANARIEGTSGGIIMTGGPIKKTHSDNFLGVGDAVGHVKPTTGGGVVLGGLCARIAGQTALNALESNDTSAHVLYNYDKSWKKQYLREFQLQKLVRFLLNNVPDKLLDALFHTIDENMRDEIQSIGDMDMQSAVIKRILFSPKLSILLVKLLSHLIF